MSFRGCMFKFIVLIFLLFFSSICLGNSQRRFLFSMEKPPVTCTRMGGTFDKSVASGSCLFISGVTATTCTSKGYKGIIQYHIPANSSGSYGGCETQILLWPCSIADQISNSYSATCGYQTCYSWGCNCGNACYSCVGYTLTSNADKVWCK